MFIKLGYEAGLRSWGHEAWDAGWIL